MEKGKTWSVVLLLLALGAPLRCGGAETKLTLLTGYNAGFAVQLGGAVSRFAEGFPFTARLALGYTMNQPGDALQARKIFINDATNGTPEKRGRVWDIRFDLLYPLSTTISVLGGVRYNAFTGNFRFVGGNEDFDVTSKLWGLGLGLEGQFRMGSRVDLVVSPGLDYFFPATLSGHDTAYNPRGEDINPRKDYTFRDADRAINQPKWVPRVMVGLAFRLGR